MTRFVTRRHGKCQELELFDPSPLLGCGPFTQPSCTREHLALFLLRFCRMRTALPRAWRKLRRQQSRQRQMATRIRRRATRAVSRSIQRFPPRLRDFATSTTCELQASAESAAINDFATSM